MPNHTAIAWIALAIVAAFVTTVLVATPAPIDQVVEAWSAFATSAP